MCQSTGGHEHRGKGGEVEHSTGLPSLVRAIMSFRSLTCETGFEEANGDFLLLPLQTPGLYMRFLEVIGLCMYSGTSMDKCDNFENERKDVPKVAFWR